MSATVVILKNDDEGFFGGASLDGVDVDKTIAAYQSQVTKAIRKRYPHLEVNHEYGPYGGRSIIVLDVDMTMYEQEEMSRIISEIVGEVYNAGNFWS